MFFLIILYFFSAFQHAKTVEVYVTLIQRIIGISLMQRVRRVLFSALRMCLTYAASF